jgi:hypothetical protein
MLLIGIVQSNANIIWKHCVETRGQCVDVECCVKGNVEARNMQELWMGLKMLLLLHKKQKHELVEDDKHVYI